MEGGAVGLFPEGLSPQEGVASGRFVVGPGRPVIGCGTAMGGLGPVLPFLCSRMAGGRPGVSGEDGPGWG